MKPDITSSVYDILNEKKTTPFEMDIVWECIKANNSTKRIFNHKSWTELQGINLYTFLEYHFPHSSNGVNIAKALMKNEVELEDLLTAEPNVLTTLWGQGNIEKTLNTIIHNNNARISHLRWKRENGL